MSKRKIGIIIGAVCLLAIGGGFIAKLQFESKVRGGIEDFLASLPPSVSAKAEKIDVSFFEKSVTLTNLKGVYNIPLRQEGKETTIPMAFASERITATGVNMDGFKEGAGVVKLIDSLTWVNTTVDSAVAKSSIENYVVENISGDFTQVYTSIEKALPALMAASAATDFPASNEDAQRIMGAAAGILKAYETLHIGKSSIKNYTYAVDVNGEKLDMTIEAADATDYSIRKMGPFSMRNVKAAYNGAPVLDMESLTSDEIILPSFVGLFEMLAKDPFPMPSMVQEAFKGQTFAMKNMRVKNMNVHHPMLKDRVLFSLADTNFNYVAETAHTMDFSFNNLNIDKSLLTAQSQLPAQVFASLPETITLEGSVQQVTTPKEKNIFDIDCKKIFLKGTGMGEATLSFAVNDLNLMALAMGMPNRSALKKYDIALTDQGASEVFFAIEGFYDENTAEQARAKELESLRAQIEVEQSQAGKDILNGLVNFLEKTGGTLQIAVQPENPSTLEQLMQAYMMNPAALGLTVTFTPGK